MNTVFHPIRQLFTSCLSTHTPPKSPVVSSTISPPVWTIYPKRHNFETGPSLRAPPSARGNPSSPRSRVFNTYELLENIFIQMSFRDLVAATAVSTLWHTIILTSKTLRNRLLLEPIPELLERRQPYTFRHKYNVENGDYWLFRIYPQSIYDSDTNKGCVIILRTPDLHVELLVHQHTTTPKATFLDPKRTRLFGIFADSIWRIDGYDMEGKVVWKDLCGVYTCPSTPFCAYLWRYLLSEENALSITACAARGLRAQSYFTKKKVDGLSVEDSSLWGWKEPIARHRLT